MKVAPLIKEMSRRKDFQNMLVHTGQHYDYELSRQFFKELELPSPRIDLDVGSAPRDAQILDIIQKLTPVVSELAPDLILVVGDVNSTLGAARTGRDLEIPVAHVEAGLRSFDLSMPEELNRIETDSMSAFLFVTEESGLHNLAAEKIRGQAHLVGNVMIDTLVTQLSKADQGSILSDIGLSPKEYVVATFHRPANVDSQRSLHRLLGMLREICSTIDLVLPLHPRTRASFENHGLMTELRALKRLFLSDPLGYLDFLKLLKESRAAITDSGGIQEETTFLRVPCLTMRDNTERPVTVTLGSNTLVGADPERVFPALQSVLRGEQRQGDVPPLWDGRTSERIIDILETSAARS